MRLGELVDLFLSEGSRTKSKSWEKNYGHALDRVLRLLGEKTLAEHVTREDCLRVLATWGHTSPANQSLRDTALRQCFEYGIKHEYLVVNPMRNIDRPKVPSPEDRDVVIVSTDNVVKMFQNCEGWADEICLGLVAYTGTRRNAASLLRWRDLELKPDYPHAPYGWMRLQEKGGKMPWKPIPAALRELIDKAPEHSPDDYLVPSYRQTRKLERHNDIIWRRVKKIAKRAGVRAHVHALRAAFAVFFLEHHGGSDRALQQWLGHESLETTRHYTRNLNRKKLLSEGVDMDWGSITSPTGVLSERVNPAGVRGSAGIGANLPTGTGPALSEKTSEGALSETEVAATVGSSPKGAPVSLSALSEGETSYGQAAPGDKAAPGSPSSESVSVSRHEEGQEQVAAHHELPRSSDSSLGQLQTALLLTALMSRLQKQEDTDNDIVSPLSGTMPEKETR